MKIAIKKTSQLRHGAIMLPFWPPVILANSSKFLSGFFLPESIACTKVK
jgi:hypothetical protein